MTRFLLILLLLGAAMPAQSADPPTRWAAAVLPSGEEFSLELAIEPAKRALGYMYREEVGTHEGMLFVFDTIDRHGIWMKNCKVALDLVWLDEQFRVLEVAYDQRPCDPERRCPTASPLQPARYVLEVAAGNARRHGLEPGARLIVLTEIPQR